MTSTVTSRIQSARSSLAIKTPCDCATTASITLSGEQTIDGVATSASRVLVRAQTNAVDNGIWISDTGSWSRAPDFDGTDDATSGTVLKVTGGSTNAGYWYLSTTTDPIIIGSTSLGFTQSDGPSATDWIQAGIGMLTQSIQAKLRKWRHGSDATGYDGTGATDSVDAVVANFTAMGAAGGTQYISNSDVVLFDKNITIPPNCHLAGPHKVTGTPGSNADAPYGDLGGVIRLNSSASITLSSGASISGLYIIRKGMTFPAADSSAYAGTAVAANGDDTAMRNCLVIGFKKCYTLTNHGRFVLDHVYADCDPSAGDGAIEISTIYDSGQIMYCHLWPFGTIEDYSTATSGGTVNLAANAYRLQRTGNGIKLRNAQDGVALVNNLVYGYKKDYDFDTCGPMTLTGGNFADNTTFHTGSVGWAISNVSDINADILWSYGTEKPFDLDIGANNVFTAFSLHSQYSTSDAVTLTSGDYSIHSIHSKNSSGAALHLASNSVRLRLENLTESGNTYANPVKVSGVNMRPEDTEIGRRHCAVWLRWRWVDD
jgi:uncharacterized cupin superfamily protein